MLHQGRLLITWEKTNKRVLPILTAPPNPFQEKYSELAREWTRKYAMWIWPPVPPLTRATTSVPDNNQFVLSPRLKMRTTTQSKSRGDITPIRRPAHTPFFSESSNFLLTQKDRLNWWWGPAHNSRRFPLFSLLKYGGGRRGPSAPGSVALPLRLLCASRMKKKIKKW